MARGGTRVPKRTKWKIYCVKYRQTETDGVIFGTISFSVYSVRHCRVEYHLECHLSLSDAEVGEDVAEDVVGGDFAGDFAEVVHCFANVLAHEVAADAVV